MGERLGRTLLGMLLAGTIAGSAHACATDAWIITTKARIALLTTAGAGGNAVKVDTEDGRVTLSGTVRSSAEKAKAEGVVRDVAGVSSVSNLLHVAAELTDGAMQIADADVRKTIAAALDSKEGLQGVAVKAVQDGVVLLDGIAQSLPQELRAIETAYECTGVRLVATHIQIRSDH